MSQYKIDFKLIEWDSPAEGIRFKSHIRNGTQLRLVEFRKGFVEPDWCTNGHVGYVLDGKMEIDFDGNVELFSTGDGLFIPSGENHKHKARVLTDVVKVILVES